jgi:hypothetical protein
MFEVRKTGRPSPDGRTMSPQISVLGDQGEEFKGRVEVARVMSSVLW